jgi:hypothetical protein
MPLGSQLVLGHAVTAPPLRDGPDGIADFGRDRSKPAVSRLIFAAAKPTLARIIVRKVYRLCLTASIDSCRRFYR